MALARVQYLRFVLFALIGFLAGLWLLGCGAPAKLAQIEQVGATPPLHSALARDLDHLRWLYVLPNGDVLTGFVEADGDAYGRPVGAALDRRGALRVADDVGNTVWRVAAIVAPTRR